MFQEESCRKFLTVSRLAVGNSKFMSGLGFVNQVTNHKSDRRGVKWTIFVLNFFLKVDRMQHLLYKKIILQGKNWNFFS